MLVWLTWIAYNFYPLLLSNIPSSLVNWNAYCYCKILWMQTLLVPPHTPQETTIFGFVPDWFNGQHTILFWRCAYGLNNQLFSIKGNVDFIPVKIMRAIVWSETLGFVTIALGKNGKISFIRFLNQQMDLSEYQLRQELNWKSQQI